MTKLRERDKLLPRQINDSSTMLVLAFSRIMGYEKSACIDFIGSPYGVVAINDEYWNMRDVYYVISNYDQLEKKFGEDLPLKVFDWYNYHVDAPSKRQINLESWLMGLRPSDIDTSPEYNEHRERELLKAKERMQEALSDLHKAADEYTSLLHY